MSTTTTATKMKAMTCGHCGDAAWVEEGKPCPCGGHFDTPHRGTGGVRIPEDASEEARKMIAVAILNGRLAGISPTPSRFMATDNGRPDLAVGQIWHTAAEADVEYDLEACGMVSDDPHTVVVLEVADYTVDDHQVVVVAVVDPFTETAGPEDILLPLGALGYHACVRMGTSVPCLAESLEECLGTLAPEDIALLREDNPTAKRGSHYHFAKDSRWQANQDLLKSLHYLQGPYLEAVFREYPG
jgi:hypothetical protein